MMLKIFLFCVLFSMFCQTFGGIGCFKKGFLTQMYGTSPKKEEIKGKSIGQIQNAMPNSANEQRDEVKIRVAFRADDGPAHAFVVVGFYEYDFVRKCARRRKFRSDIDKELDEFDKKKDQSFKGDGLFAERGKAESVFFEMSGRFWFEEFYSYNKANCLDFVFNFVCALFDGKCPQKSVWPDNFVEFDNDMINGLSYLNPENIIRQGIREPQSVFERQQILLPNETIEHQNCILKDHRLEIRIKNCVENGVKCANFIFFHLTGRFDGPIHDREQLKNRIFVQTKPEKSRQNVQNGVIHLSVVLKAYSCKISDQNAWKTFVSDLNVLDETTKHFLIMKNVCHFHNLKAVNIDELTNHLVEIEFDKWAKIEIRKE